MRFTRVLLFSLILLALAASALQEQLHIFRETRLVGFYHKYPPPSLDSATREKWFSGAFQEGFARCLNDHAGFRNSLIRIGNQVDHSLFGMIHAEGFTCGRHGFLYEEDYIHEYTGEYFIGQKVIDRELYRLKNVSDSLRARGIQLLLVFEPGKASFYPEYIARRFHPAQRTLSNYSYMTRRAREIGLEYLDLNSYFLAMKDTARYPLFPKYGMHWSLSAVPCAVDTLAAIIREKTGRAVPRFRVRQFIGTRAPVGSDNDIGGLLNLVFPLAPATGAIPQLSFDPSPAPCLKVLSVADSYYLNIINTYGRRMFRQQDYWYYNRKMYPYQNNDPPEYVDKSNLRSQLAGYDVVLLMVSEINLHCGFWNFADEAYAAFHPEVHDPLFCSFENDIRNDREWFRFIVNKARLQGRPLDELIREDALYTFNTRYNTLEGKGYWDTIYHTTFDIRNNPEWFAQVAKKAADRKIPVDSMLLLDAIYCYGQSKNKH